MQPICLLFHVEFAMRMSAIRAGVKCNHEGCSLGALPWPGAGLGRERLSFLRPRFLPLLLLRLRLLDGQQHRLIPKGARCKLWGARVPLGHLQQVAVTHLCSRRHAF